MVRFKIIIAQSLIILAIPSLVLSQQPYRSCWSTDGWIFGTGGAIAVSALLANQSIPSLTELEVNQLSRENVIAFDRGATYHYSEPISQVSDVLVGLNAATGLLFLLDRDIREDWRTLGIMSLETALMVTAVPRLVKLQVQRIRPYVYNPDAPLQIKLQGEAKRSFFSGHTTTAFATAVFISTVYGDYFPGSKWKPYIWSGSLLMASTIGILRLESGKHFPTDIITGAVVGSAIGYIIPCLHRKSKGNLTMIPTFSDRMPQLGIRFQF